MNASMKSRQLARLEYHRIQKELIDLEFNDHLTHEEKMAVKKYLQNQMQMAECLAQDYATKPTNNVLCP